MVESIKYLTARAFVNIPIKDRLEIWAELTDGERQCVIDSANMEEMEIIDYTNREVKRRSED